SPPPPRRAARPGPRSPFLLAARARPQQKAALLAPRGLPEATSDLAGGDAPGERAAPGDHRRGAQSQSPRRPRAAVASPSAAIHRIDHDHGVLPGLQWASPGVVIVTSYSPRAKSCGITTAPSYRPLSSVDSDPIVAPCGNAGEMSTTSTRACEQG